MICSPRLGELIFALFRLLRAQSNCFGHGTNARFGGNRASARQLFATLGILPLPGSLALLLRR